MGVALARIKFKMVYRPGRMNNTDALSTSNSVEPCESGGEYDLVRSIVENCVPVALSPREIEGTKYNDEEMCQVKNCTRSGNWQHCALSL